MSYLTFDEYTERGGTLDGAAFSKCAVYAELKLNALTPIERHPLTVTEAVKQAMVYLIDNYAAQRFAGKNQQVASFSNDGVSVTFKNTTAQEDEQEIFSIVHALLPYETRLGVKRCM